MEAEDRQHRVRGCSPDFTNRFTVYEEQVRESVLMQDDHMYTYNQFRSGQNAFDKGLNRSISSDAVEMQSLGDISDINAEEQYHYTDGYMPCTAI